MVVQSNHSFRTFNLGYAGATALTTNALLHRGHRASQAWQQFFRFDQTLQGKRPRGASDAAVLAATSSLASRVRKGCFQPVRTYTETELLATARQLYNDPNREAASIWAQIPGGERILPTQNAVGAEIGGPRY